jgi:anti-anti-sigma regulatory factor
LSRVAGKAPTRVVVVLDAVPSGLALVDLVARLRMVARQAGCSIMVRDPSAELCELLDLAGLAGVIEVSRSALQADGKAEDGEQLRVEEVLPGGDAPA